MIRTKRELIIDQRSAEEKQRELQRVEEISDQTLQFNPGKNQKIRVPRCSEWVWGKV